MPFWGQNDTTIHFCEDAYVESKYIAEYYNSLSGVSYSLVGLYFYNTKLSHISYTLVLLGVGTITLHATQRWYGQYLDELSMLYLSFQIIKYLRNKYHKKTSDLWIPLALSTYLHNYNFIFILMFSLCQTYILFYLKKPPINKKYKSTIYIYNLIYKISFIASLIIWCIDQICCSYTKPYYLHAWWHVGTSISIFFGLNELLLCK